MPPRNIAKAQDAIALLKADHRKVEDLFESAQNAKGAKKKALVKQICTELTIHTLIEEEIFYPACREAGVEDPSLNEAYVEHDGAKVMICELEASDGDDPFYDAKVKVLSEDIKHHVKEEEQRGGIFAQAKAAGLDMDWLGRQLAMRKRELKEEIAEDGIPTPETRTFIGGELIQGSPDDVPEAPDVEDYIEAR